MRCHARLIRRPKVPRFMNVDLQFDGFLSMPLSVMAATAMAHFLYMQVSLTMVLAPIWLSSDCTRTITSCRTRTTAAQ